MSGAIVMAMGGSHSYKSSVEVPGKWKIVKERLQGDGGRNYKNVCGDMNDIAKYEMHNIFF